MFAFIWDIVVAQIHRVQRPVDLQRFRQCHNATAGALWALFLCAAICVPVVVKTAQKSAFDRPPTWRSNVVRGQIKGGQRPVDCQHVGDQLGACCIDLGVTAVMILDGEAFQRIVGLQSITESANTVDTYFVAAQVCAFQRPVDIRNNSVP